MEGLPSGILDLITAVSHYTDAASRPRERNLALVLSGGFNSLMSLSCQMDAYGAVGGMEGMALSPERATSLNVARGAKSKGAADSADTPEDVR